MRVAWFVLCWLSCLSSSSVLATSATLPAPVSAPAPVPHLEPLPTRGHGAVMVGASIFGSRVAWDDDGVAIAAPGVAIQRYTLLAGATVGVGERLGLGLRLPVVMTTGVATTGESRTVTGGGDATVGLTLDDGASGPLRFALRGEVKLPLYGGAPALQGRQPSPTEPTQPGVLPALGDGQTDVTVGAIMVARFPFGGFFSWEQGYRFRTGGVTDGVVGVGRIAVPTFEGRVVPRWDHAFLFSFDPALDDDGVATEVVGRSLVDTGPGCTIAVPEVWPGFAVDVATGLLFRGRNAVGGVRFDIGVIHAF